MELQQGIQWFFLIAKAWQLDKQREAMSYFRIFTHSLYVFYAITLCSIASAAGTLTQWSTLDALLKGLYGGVVELREVVAAGDFGLGTFDDLDGEMVVLDGRIYQVDAEGNVRVPELTTTTPFAVVTAFEKDFSVSVGPVNSLAELEAQLDAALPSRNYFYAIRIDGDFEKVTTRSVPAQSEPYPPLVEVIEYQPVFELGDSRGTLVGIWCPAYVRGINLPGHHFHYIDDARESGGHVLDLQTSSEIYAEISVIRRFILELPDGDAFRSIPLP